MISTPFHVIIISNHTTKVNKLSLQLPNEVLNELKKLKFENNSKRVQCGNQWVETDRLFIKWNGEPMHPSTPYWWLQKFCLKNNLPFKGVHAFRHSFATQAILNAKVDVITVSAILGHSQTSTTLEIYAHAFQEANAQALDSVANLFRRETKVASK
jgi:integrase